ncbi:hypothetical protein M434DRAFT_13023 [Hypoxylon sp. CO27-5]|nr:hypothetical protein M434DRAFT_13023 [Hypoxylon sp. CO27-5]
MSQEFILEAPRDRLTCRWGTHLPSGLFCNYIGNRIAEKIVKLLVVPVPPRHRSSTSNSTPSTLAQFRRDINLPQSGADSSPQQASCHESEKGKASDKVLLDYTRHRKRAGVVNGSSDDKSDANYPITIFSLPTELHHLIFSHIGRIDDVVCLAVTNHHFWEVGREYIDKYFDKYFALTFGQWAGKNIVCAGADVQPGDFPPGLFSAQEIARLAHLSRNKLNVPVSQICIPHNFFDTIEGEDISPDETPDVPVPFTLHHLCSRSVTQCQPIEPNIERAARALFSRCLRRKGTYHGKPDQGLLLKRSAIEVKESSYFPENEVWILRNLTTKEFVRSESIALHPEYIKGPRISLIGFGEVIMSRTCWTTSPTVRKGKAQNMFRGVWAGHRFDITTVSRHEEQTKGETWSDVGMEVGEEIKSIWECLVDTKGLKHPSNFDANASGLDLFDTILAGAGHEWLNNVQKSL